MAVGEARPELSSAKCVADKPKDSRASSVASGVIGDVFSARKSAGELWVWQLL